MKIGELINILRTYNPDYEFMISTEDSLWSIEQKSFREATIHETENNGIVDAEEYDPAVDKKILNSMEVVLIDIDI
jgi:hypothetical protein